ncbi:MAG: HAD family phosphatase [Bryobacterales bacterium]|nr:HAD family phosphatase [Bryobacteraceae bacterium]MDW8356109.1 HAD family phosphatase [Bryobacterales bacterium]
MKRAVLWDLDGTLVDSEEYHWRAWRDTMAAEGVPLTREQFLATFGQRNDSILRLWLGERATPEAIRRIGEAKEACYRRLVRELGLCPAPGAAEWIRRLHAENWAQAVASSAPRRNVETVLEVTGLAPYFAATVAAEDVTRGKPDPEVFLVAAARLGVPPDRCVVVEDAPAGIEAARRAGMRTIALSRGSGAPPADVVVGSLGELPPAAFARLIER